MLDNQGVALAVQDTSWLLVLAMLMVAAFVVTLVVLVRSRLRRETAHRAQLNQLAYFDAVTTAPNRHYFLRNLQRAIGRARRESLQVGIVLIDLDQFKWINDTLGHTTGETCLKLVAERLKFVLSEARTRQTLAGRETELELARIGGDEFVILAAGTITERDVVDLADSVRVALVAPLRYQRHDLSITASIGVAMCPRDGDEVNALLRNADTALHEAKAGGRNQHRIYRSRMSERVRDRVRLESDLRGASVAAHPAALHVDGLGRV